MALSHRESEESSVGVIKEIIINFKVDRSANIQPKDEMGRGGTLLVPGHFCPGILRRHGRLDDSARRCQRWVRN